MRARRRCTRHLPAAAPGARSLRQRDDLRVQRQQRGRLLVVTEPAGHTTSYTYGGGIGDNLSRIAREGHFSLFVYDSAGRVTQASDNVLGTTRRGYDVLNRPLFSSVNTTVASGGPTGLVAYGYDGWGRRVRRSLTRGGVTTTTGYLHAGDHVVAELSATGAVVADYAWHPGVDAPHSLRRGSQIYYYTQEAEGNVTALLGASETVANRYAYTAFGELTLVQETVPNPFRFKGTAYDSTARLYHMRARDYDPGLGRFVSEDPIGLEGGINTYAFAGNDPVNNRDPSGLDFLVECTPIYGWSRAGTPLYPGSWTPYLKGYRCSSSETGDPAVTDAGPTIGPGRGGSNRSGSRGITMETSAACTAAAIDAGAAIAGDLVSLTGFGWVATRGTRLAPIGIKLARGGQWLLRDRMTGALLPGNSGSLRSTSNWMANGLVGVGWMGTSNALQAKSLDMTEELLSLLPGVNAAMKVTKAWKRCL